MASKRVDFSFSRKGIVYLLFSKKKCPKCSNIKMKRIVKKDYVGKGESIRITHFGEKPDAYLGTIFYNCPKCDNVYELEDLAVSTTPMQSSKSELKQSQQK